jgi:NADH-quinone oxidoreductase subunit H
MDKNFYLFFLNSKLYFNKYKYEIIIIFLIKCFGWFLTLNYIFFFNFFNLTFFILIIKILSIILPLLISIAFSTLLERKIIGYMQRRKGPNNVGFLGILQPIADGIKLFLKESLIPSFSNQFLFLLSPVIAFFLALLLWPVIPFSIYNSFFFHDYSLLYILMISSLSVYAIIYGGWSSNSKYPFLGAMRSAAQMISYELGLSMIILILAFSSNTLSLYNIIIMQQNLINFFPHFPLFILFLISILAETNRHPFDLPEAEAELVSGYNVEYSSMTFALFFLGEYSNILFMSALTICLFFGGFFNIFLDNIFFFSIKIALVFFFFVWVRVTLPRYRYDQLMLIGWKNIIPITFGWFVFIIFYVYLLDNFLDYKSFDYINSNLFSKNQINLENCNNLDYYDYNSNKNNFIIHNEKQNLFDFFFERFNIWQENKNKTQNYLNSFLLIKNIQNDINILILKNALLDFDILNKNNIIYDNNNQNELLLIFYDLSEIYELAINDIISILGYKYYLCNIDDFNTIINNLQLINNEDIHNNFNFLKIYEILEDI